jgi:acetyl-CoA C-acetyltransferase
MGDTSIMIAGGMESMSSSRHAVHMRPGVKFGDVSMDDTLLKVHHILFLLLASIK